MMKRKLIKKIKEKDYEKRKIRRFYKYIYKISTFINKVGK